MEKPNENWTDESGADYVGSQKPVWNDNWLNITRDRKDKNLHVSPESMEAQLHEHFEICVREKRKKGRPYKISWLIALVECIRNFDSNPDVQRLWPRARQMFCLKFREIWPHRYHYLDKKNSWAPIKRDAES